MCSEQSQNWMRAAQVSIFRPYFGATITISVVMSFLILYMPTMSSLVATETCFLPTISASGAPLRYLCRTQAPYWSNSTRSDSLARYHCFTAAGGWLPAKR